MPLTSPVHVQGNFSDFLVHLSNIYSLLRGDTSGTKNEDDAQGFIRTTTKYWVGQTSATASASLFCLHCPMYGGHEETLAIGVLAHGMGHSTILHSHVYFAVPWGCAMMI